VSIAGGVVRASAAAVARIVAASIADADVQVAIASEVEIPGVVVTRERDDVVDEDAFGGAIHLVCR
jgi:hypothetical protein